MKDISCCLFLTIIKLTFVKAFHSTSRYLDDLLNIDNPYFEQMVSQIYPTELQLNKANSFDKPTFWTWTCPFNRWYSFILNV